MPPSGLRWAFHSPARLVAVCALVAAMILLSVVLAAGETDRPHETMMSTQQVPQEPPSSTRVAPSAAASESVNAGTRADVTEAVRTFIAQWGHVAKQESRPHWLRDLKPLTTAALYRGLQATDPARVPNGAVETLQVVRIGAFGGTALVSLSNGPQVEVHLVAAGGRWIVSDIRPADA